MTIQQRSSKLKLSICLVLLFLFLVVLGCFYSNTILSAKFRSLMDDQEVTYETYTLEVFDFDTKALMRISNVRIDDKSEISSALFEETSKLDWLHHLEIRCGQVHWDQISSKNSVLPEKIKKISLGNADWFRTPVVIKSKALTARRIIDSGCEQINLVGVDLAKSEIDLQLLISELKFIQIAACIVSQNQMEMIERSQPKDPFQAKVLFTKR